MTFSSPVDIANRALQHVGASRITGTAWPPTEDTKAASEVAFAYDKVRRAELRRNVWRFAIRKAVLRPLDPTVMLLNPPLWDSASVFGAGSIVADANGQLWSSNSAVNAGNTPGASRYWSSYFGSLAVSQWAAATSYFSGELVYVTDNKGSFKVYVSVVSSNSDTPGTPDAYDPTIAWSAGSVVTYNSTLYQSNVDMNLGNTPGVGTYWTTNVTTGSGSTNWRQLSTAAVQNIDILYPLGAGPSSQQATRNIYLLPNGFLRQAPQDPKAGSWSYLGGPSGSTYKDWEYESDFIITQDFGPIVLRFVADVTDVPSMDDMFCEGLAARIGLEVCEELTQSGGKLQAITAAYNRFMGEARIVNGIETGSVEPDEDDYITARR